MRLHGMMPPSACQSQAEIVKLPRTIRLDPSDTFVFERVAEPGEWAISGSFLFLDAAPESLNAKQRHALRSGFLGVASLGFSTLATVSPATQEEFDAARDMLATAFVEKFGAPSSTEARKAADAELIYAQSLCDHPAGTLIAVQRTFDESGALREQFRTLRPREGDADQDSLHKFARAFTFHEVEEASETMPDEQVDLLALQKTARP